MNAGALDPDLISLHELRPSSYPLYVVITPPFKISSL
jgi:hypothetical protein